MIASWLLDLTAAALGGAPQLERFTGRASDSGEGRGTADAAWAVVQPVLGNVTPVHEYEPGTWGPKEADRLTQKVGGWHAPQ